MRVWHQSGRGAWQLYGHSHGKLPPAEGSPSMDAGVDTNAFRPYSLVELQSMFAVVGFYAKTLTKPRKHS